MANEVADIKSVLVDWTAEFTIYGTIRTNYQPREAAIRSHTRKAQAKQLAALLTAMVKKYLA